MAALTQDKIVKTRGEGYESRLPIATGGKIYRGSLVHRSTTSGRASAGASGTNREIAGVAVRFEGSTGTGTGNTGGTEYVVVKHGCHALVNLLTALRTNAALGLNVFLSTDQDCGGTGVGTAGVRCHVGELLEFEASDKTTGWVALRQFSHTDVTV